MFLIQFSQTGTRLVADLFHEGCNLIFTSTRLDLTPSPIVLSCLITSIFSQTKGCLTKTMHVTKIMGIIKKVILAIIVACAFKTRACLCSRNPFVPSWLMKEKGCRLAVCVHTYIHIYMREKNIFDLHAYKQQQSRLLLAIQTAG